ncbi:DgyrCDS13977 [Dimorphilus gyrociliatus]|uniref:DgyrCDS13977 n=1 Tax=Dimorphilus gyrociliatus TaxID=2664684 RepID=A0A7I8WC98_9ANNE|nr:DgyrCDS13977 [Dimorphilus gyrociliatus]
MEDEYDVHLCLVCKQSITGLEEYIKHKREECVKPKETDQNTIDFLSSLNLQQNLKKLDPLDYDKLIQSVVEDVEVFDTPKRTGIGKKIYEDEIEESINETPAYAGGKGKSIYMCHTRNPENLGNSLPPEPTNKLSKTNADKARPIYHCGTCRRDLLSKFSYDAHCRTSLHKKRLASMSFDCDVCQVKLSNRYTFEKHMKSAMHSKRKNFLFSCRICSFCTDSKEDVDGHLKDDGHLKSVSGIEIICSCGKLVEKDHFEAHHSANESCILSVKSPTKPSTLKRFSQQSKICTECGLKCRSNFALNLHYVRKHSEDKRFNCASCKLSFSDKYSLFSHENSKKHHRSKSTKPRKLQKPFETYRCNRCEFKTEKCTILKDHYKRIHSIDFLCEICKESFLDDLDLKAHKSTCHNPEANDTNLWACTKCQATFDKREPRDEHMKEKHGIFSKSGTFNCGRCGLKFFTGCLLRRHVKMKHTQDSKQYICKHCSKAFHFKYQLSQHERIHSGDKPFTCFHCDYKARTNDLLTKHVNGVHFKQKQYPCNYCTFKASSGSSLTQHMRIHSASKPYQV